jgi:iron(III) transport system substrate-binding protein
MSREREAEREGHLVIYASLRGVLLNLVTAFRRRYKDLHIHVHFLSSHPIPILQRIRAEVAVGLPTADIAIVPHYAVLQLVKEGLTRTYDSSQFSYYPSSFYNIEEGWAALAIEPIGMIYNSGLLSAQDLPTTSDELFNESWRGKVATQYVTTFSEGMMGAFYLIALKRRMKESKWYDFLHGIATKLDPFYYECLLHMSHSIARGEQLIGFPATLRKASMADAAEGGPVDTLHLMDLPDLACMRTMCLIKAGKHPNAAELFFDFALSKEWQDEMGEKLEGMIPSRPGTVTKYWVTKPLQHGLEYFPVHEEVERLEEYVSVFRDLGLK